MNVQAGKSIAILESFSGFYEINDQIGQAFESTIIKISQDKQLDLKKCRGQEYDGAANMRGKHRGLQARIKSRVSTNDYVHCAAHNLNLVVNDPVSNSEIGNFLHYCAENLCDFQ